ncbi:unnamed protein product [Prunus armeniaca]
MALHMQTKFEKYWDTMHDLMGVETSSSNENEAKIVTVQYEEVDNNEEEDLGGYGRHLLDGDGDRDFPKSLNQGLGRERGRGWRAGTGMILPYPVPNQPVAIPNL